MEKEANRTLENWIQLPSAEPESPNVYFIGDDEVWVTQVDGKTVGLSNICTHRLGPMAEGRRLSENCVQCPWHGYEFDMRTSECTNHKVPALRRYEVKTENGTTWVRRI